MSVYRHTNSFTDKNCDQIHQELPGGIKTATIDGKHVRRTVVVSDRKRQHNTWC